MNFTKTILNRSLNSGATGRLVNFSFITYEPRIRKNVFILIAVKLGHIVGKEILSESRLPFVYPVCPRCGETTSLTIEGCQSTRRCTRCRWIETHGASLVVTVVGHMFCKECGRFLLPTERVEAEHGYCAVCQESTRKHG